MWRACDAKLQGRHSLVAMFAEGGAVCRECVLSPYGNNTAPLPAAPVRWLTSSAMTATGKLGSLWEFEGPDGAPTAQLIRSTAGA